MNDKRFDGGQLSVEEKNLRDFYQRLLNVTISNDALMGAYREIHYFNKEQNPEYDHRIFSFVRWNGNEKLLVVANFDTQKAYDVDLKLPSDLLEQWGLEPGTYQLKELLYGAEPSLDVKKDIGTIPLELAPLESVILKLEQ